MWLALHHPVSPAAAVAGVVGLFGLAFLRPLWTLAVIPVVVPTLSFAPWTGWMLVEEVDLALLAMFAGAAAALALQRPLATAEHPPRRWGDDGPARVGWLLALLALAVLALGVQRGLEDAGAWPLHLADWGWWQGWREPMNVIRLAKPYVAALAWWPLWQAMQSRAPRGSSLALGVGLVAGLGATAAMVTEERWAWTGLTNFSTDYRTTGPFWEMHVGGAALDAFFGLTLPFLFWALATERDRRRWAGLLVLGLVVAYAVLTMFSRGLYLAVVVSAAVWALLSARALRARGATRERWPWPTMLGWCVVFAGGAWILFVAGGYRALAAWWGLFALAFAGWGRHGGRSLLRPDVGAALLAAGALLAVASLLTPPSLKLPYLLYAALAGGTALAVGRRDGFSLRVPWLGWWLATAPAALAIAWRWGEGRWASGAMLAVAALMAVGVGAARWAPARGPEGSRWRAAALSLMAVVAFVVASLGGGEYLDERLASADQDWQGRETHWTRSLALTARDGRQVWGVGVGRFAAAFAIDGPGGEQPGDYRWQPDERGGHLILTSGHHVIGFGELFRLSQRLPAVPDGPLTVRWRARAEAPVNLHVEVCRRHLLYVSGCRTVETRLQPTPDGGWRDGTVLLQGAAMSRAPVFSIGLETRAARLEIDDLQVLDASGRDLLRNGSFDDGLAFWLPSSDRWHLPWHAKNLLLHVYVEQGLLGLASFVILFVFALARVVVGSARSHPLSPALAAGLLGLVVVGAFDSVLDVPRVAFLFYLLLGVAATLRWPWPADRSDGAGARR